MSSVSSFFILLFFFNEREGAQGLNIKPATDRGESLYLWSLGLHISQIGKPASILQNEHENYIR